MGSSGQQDVGEWLVLGVLRLVAQVGSRAEGWDANV